MATLRYFELSRPLLSNPPPFAIKTSIIMSETRKTHRRLYRCHVSWPQVTSALSDKQQIVIHSSIIVIVLAW